jgi:Polyketide cyclase / dehydrase and lipid transport
MKKFVQFVIGLVLIVLLAIFVIGLVEPREVVIMRSTVIRAPKEVVFDQIMRFKNWTNWSPWYKMDSDKIKISYAGTDGVAGSSYHWEGSDKTGAGDMKNIGVDGTQMNFEMNIIRPLDKTIEGYIKVTDTAGMARVVWRMEVKMSYPFNAALLLLNFDKFFGGDLDAGLANMKQYVEVHNTVPIINTEVKEVDYAAHTFEGIRRVVPWSDLMKFFSDSYSIVAQDVDGKIDGTMVGIFYTWDTVNKQTDAMAAFPVTDTTAPVAGTAFVHAGPAKAVMAVEKGGYSHSKLYHDAIQRYMAAHNMRPAMVVEEYVVNYKQQADSNKWVTNIYYLAQ